jgi:hypothetical protein
MKKIALALTCLLMFGAGQAMASFDTDSLYMSVYNNNTTTGDVEFGFSTGFNLETVDWSKPVNFTVETGLSTDLFDAATWADLQVGFFGNNYLTPTSSYGQFYMASLNPNTVPNGTQRTGYRTATEGVKGAYNQYDTDDDGTVLLANNLSGNGYDMLMNGAGTSPGQYNGFNVVDSANGEGNLGVFGDADPTNDSITMYLVGYQRLSFGDTGGSLTNGLMSGVNYLATITLEADGTLTISNVPVPGAIWLLGSGLLGLLGLRRRIA